MEQHHVGMFHTHLIEDVPDAGVIVAVQATRKGDFRTSRHQRLDLNPALGGEKIPAVDHRRGESAVVDLRARTRVPGRACVPLEEISSGVAEELHGVATLDHGEALGDKPLELDGADLGAILFLLAALLTILVTIELALNAIGRAMEEVDGRPEQVLKIGFEPGIAERRDEGVEDVGEGTASSLFIGQRSRIGFVLMRTVAVELKLVDDSVRGRSGVQWLNIRLDRHSDVSVDGGRAHRGLRGEKAADGPG